MRTSAGVRPRSRGLLPVVARGPFSGRFIEAERELAKPFGDKPASLRTEKAPARGWSGATAAQIGNSLRTRRNVP
jgi:hypothetical protein